jgi:methionyl-tRNA synthetase
MKNNITAQKSALKGKSGDEVAGKSAAKVGKVGRGADSTVAARKTGNVVAATAARKTVKVVGTVGAGAAAAGKAAPKKKTYYITTPIYYPSAKWHLGHCYTTVICDSLARFKRMQGFEVFYLTGTDEHGQKIEERAKAADMEPQKFVDGLVAEIKELWSILNISYDKFIRTTDDEHKRAIQKIFETLHKNGDIYKSDYEGLYCTPCETFWTESQAADGVCPDCGRKLSKAKEESYFFRLSKYADKLLKLYSDNPDFIQPKTRENEMVGFIKSGLSDLAVSRTSFRWGIEVPFDDKHVVYVWVDALNNYITALGYDGQSDAPLAPLMKKFWPADVHMVGKEIMRFHSIIWPALLMALGLPLPKQVYGHGWLLLGGDKMSKSKGNVVDPFELVGRYGCDAIRYYLLREVPFGNDGSYTGEAFLNRINADLCNDLGNLLSRTTAMVHQYFGGLLPAPAKQNVVEDAELLDVAQNAYAAVCAAMDALDVPKALSEIFKLIQRANKYIDQTAPWVLNKNGDKNRLATVLYNISECLRIAGVLLSPFLPDTAGKILGSFGIDPPKNFDGLKESQLKAGTRVTKPPALYPRLDIQKELIELEG